MKTANELAREILEQGFRDFVGEGIVVEIASEILPADETSTLPPIETPNLPPLKPLSSGVGGWREFVTVKPASKPPARNVDYAAPDIAATKPGSVERIEAMRNLYAPAADEIANLSAQAMAASTELDPNNQPSAFDMPLDTMADKLAALGLDYVVETLADGSQRIKAVQHDKPTTRKPRGIRKKLSE